MRARLVRRFLCGALPLMAPATLLAQAAADSAEEWSIEVSHAPTTRTLAFMAEEGTWMSVDVSPDGTKLAFDLLGHLYEMPIAGGDAVALTAGRSWNMFPRYSPDGTTLAFTSDRSGSEDLWILHLGTDSLENVSQMEIPVVQPTWARDGRALYGTAHTEHAKTTGYRFNLWGTRQEIVESNVFQPLTHFVEHPDSATLYYEHLDQQLYQSGARIKTYDLETGETEVYLQRAGGAFNPAISPNGRYLAYGHRDDQETVLVLHDLVTREERVLVRGLDRDHQEYGPYYYGVSPNVAWGPGGREIYLAYGGRIRAVNVLSGVARVIPFRAPVRRELDETIRFPVDVPDGATRTYAHRWAHRTEQGILYEALGDIYLQQGDQRRNLTDSPAHETSPVYSRATGSVYYAGWTDDSLGAIYRRPLAGGAPTKLTDRPTQYGSLAVSADGRGVAFVRGTGRLHHGVRIENQIDFELMVIGRDGRERKVADVSGTDNFSSRLPLSITFAPDGGHLYYTEFLSDTLTLRRIRLDGLDKVTLYRFPHAARAVLSPDLRWIAFREYHRSYVTPFEFIGKPVTVSAHDGLGFTKRVDDTDGPYLAWSPDGRMLSWSRDGKLFEKSLDAILQGDSAEPRVTTIAVAFDVAKPASTIALTGVRVLTMNPAREVLERATIVVARNRIAAVGATVPVPAGARVFDLTGHTVMPGMVDAHAHPNPLLSQTNFVEQRFAGLHAALAYGVTTMYELYGTAEKDFWVRDMLRAGKMTGPRLFSVGSPMYGLRHFRPKLYRHLASYDDALEHVRYNRDAGATALKDYVNFTRIDRHQLATAARELGVNIVAETAGNAPMNFTQVVDGETGLEHSMGLTPLYQDVIELFRASAIGITPTLLVVYNGPNGQAYFNQSVRVWEDAKLLHFTRKEDLLGFRRVPHFWEDDLYAPEMAGEMKKLFDAGVLINMGGHGQMLGLDAHWEMELFVQGGFSPLEAMQVATINPATYHGLAEDIGSIEPGKLADLVVLRDNPLEDIRNTRSIVYVIKNGVVYDGADAARVWPDPAPAGRMYFRR